MVPTVRDYLAAGTGDRCRITPFPPTLHRTLSMKSSRIFSQIVDREGVAAVPAGRPIVPLLGAAVGGWEIEGRGFVCTG